MSPAFGRTAAVKSCSGSQLDSIAAYSALAWRWQWRYSQLGHHHLIVVAGLREPSGPAPLLRNVIQVHEKAEHSRSRFQSRLIPDPVRMTLLLLSLFVAEDLVVLIVAIGVPGEV